MSRFKRPRGATALPTKSETLTVALHRRRGAVPAVLGLLAISALLLGLDGPDAADSAAGAAAEQAASAGGTGAGNAANTVATRSTERREKASPALPLQAEISPAATTPAAEPEPVWQEQSVGPGDNLAVIFKRAGFSSRDLHDVVSQAADGQSLARIYPGQVIAFRADSAGELAAVRHVRSPLEAVTYRRGDDGYVSETSRRQPQAKEAWASGVITSSLFLAGQEAGLSHNMIMELAGIFGGVIDFALDPRKGDTLHVIYEDMYLDGERFGDGDIVAASFTNRGKTYNAYRYTDSNGDIGYFNEQGVSMRKAFLLTPVDFTRISSNFNLRRLHPIYKTRRPHRGTDYAAPTGTPVFAAGDGRVIRAGYSRANGNYVFIQHGERYVTKYLHLHNRKVNRGQRVTQNQVIGTVGATGAATGPHLHYEFLVDGVHRNPRTIHKQLPKAKSLAASELENFRLTIGDSSRQLASLQSDTQIAMSEPTGSDRARN